MKNSEEAIGRVLAGLRDVDTPEGMGRRILEGLEGRTAIPSRSGWRRFIPMSLVIPQQKVGVTGLVCAATLAGVLVVLFAIPAVRRVGPAPVHSKIGAAPVAGLPRPPRSVVTPREQESSARGSNVRLGTATQLRDARSLSTADSEDSLAISEMQAPSFPAPPMPLTEQERLLLRIALKVDPVEVAMLDPKVRAMQDAEEKAEFQRFFGQTARKPLPAQLPPPAQPTTEQGAPQQSTTEQASPEPAPTEQTMPGQSTPEQATPPQANADESTSNRPIEDRSKPQEIPLDQSITQHLTAGPIRTGENE